MMAAADIPVPAARRVLGSPGLRLAGRRVLAAIPVLWGVTFLTYVVMNLLPGDGAGQPAHRPAVRGPGPEDPL